MARYEIAITGDLIHGLSHVLGGVPATADPVVVLSGFLDRFAKQYGLSESGDIDADPLDVLGLPDELEVLLAGLLGLDARVTSDEVRRVIYDALTEVAAQQSSRRVINKTHDLSEEAILVLGQVCWNIETNGSRPRLPLKRLEIGGRTVCDIQVPGTRKDFATMMWAERANEKCGRKSSGQSFRKQAARLTVLMAQHILAGRDIQADVPVAANLTQDPDGRYRVVWTWDEAPTVSGAPAARTEAARALPSPAAAEVRSAVPGPVCIGAPADVGAGYQPRFVEVEIGHHWAEGGDGRVWLTGGPGLGKSFTARKLMRDALADRSDERASLLVWVDSAGVESVQAALAEAGEALRARGLMGPPTGSKSPGQEARAVLAALATSAWRWLVVLDNADADELIDANLVPSGANPGGRTVITTTSRSVRMGSHGRVVRAEHFSDDEAVAFLRSDVHRRNGADSPFAQAAEAQLATLAHTVGHHPLALSIAAATIASNALEIDEWISEFTADHPLDLVADERDPGGYPRLIAATWRAALARASRGLPEGLVERAVLVAALQATDGHPTWVWDTEAVATWVAGGGTLQRRHRVPVVVQRLIDHSIVDLRGGSWRNGRVAMHQLAARAVREHFDGETVHELAHILSVEWLKRITLDEPAHSVLLANTDALDEVVGLQEPASYVVAALRSYLDRPSLGTVEFGMNRVRAIAPALLRAGAVGQVRWAELWLAESIELERTGVDDAALAARGLETPAAMRAAVRDVLEKTVEREEGAWRGRSLGQLAAAHQALGDEAKAAAARAQAIATYEGVIADARELNAWWLTDLADLYVACGLADRRAQLFERADRVLKGEPPVVPDTVGDAALVVAQHWYGKAKVLAALGRRGEAIESAQQALVALGGQPRHPSLSHYYLMFLAGLHIEERAWAEAEECLTRALDSRDLLPGRRVLLASVQLHRGLSERALATLAHARFMGRRHSEGDSPTHLHLDPDVKEVLERTYAEMADSLTMVNGLELQEQTLVAATSERWGDALSLTRSRLEHLESHPDPDQWAHESQMADELSFAGLCASRAGEHREAVGHLERSISIQTLLAEMDPAWPPHDMHVALHRLRNALQGLQEWGQASDVADRLVEALEARLLQAPADVEPVADLSEALVRAAGLHFQAGDTERPGEPAGRAVSLLEAAIDAHPDEHRLRRLLIDALTMSAIVTDDPEAWGCFRRCVEIYEHLLVVDPGKHESDFVELLLLLASGLEQQGDPEAAEFRARAAELGWSAEDEA
ncbi:hypothetical protein IEQ44_15385 [Nocardioides sp. Y6]|uniref:Tetratricopeptide repeat protein n=1 Tax=Nocardioides malaquae TaxID=2773426 RepID=A0ABR9RWS1_9ACTN|nr:NB-ARC domain-containing protein [Nocardioides malaquae]MBE7326032.1 hypothetical protein [Nocardioides malaquae]